MAAFKRMLQVGIKVDNCLMRYRASKARSTSSSSSSKEFSNVRSHPGPSSSKLFCRMSTLQHKAVVPYVSPIERALINILREQGFTDEECKRIAAAAMVLSEGLETETHSLLQKGEIHKAKIAQDSRIAEYEQEISYKQKLCLSLWAVEMEKLWKEPDRKMMKYGVVMEKMISEARSRSVLAQEAIKDEAFKMWMCACFFIASAGIAVISFLKW